MHSKSILDILYELGITIDSDARKILYILMREEIVNENDIADKLGMKINDVRKPLYKLSELGVVSYTKAKDIEKKWWYIYNWQLDKAKIHFKYMLHLKNILHHKERDMINEQEYAFQCRRCKRKYVYDDALENDFICESEGCSGVVRAVTNSRVISQLSVEIKELLKQIHFEEEVARRNQEKQRKAMEALLKKEAEEEAKEEEKKKAAKKKVVKKKQVPKKRPVRKVVKKIVKKKVVKKKPKPKKKLVKKKIVKKKPKRRR